MNIRTLSFAALTAALALSACSPKNEQSADNAASAGKAGNVKLLNVSYDVARDFYKEYNPLFVKEYAAKNGGATVEIQQSHGRRFQIQAYFSAMRPQNLGFCLHRRC